MTTYTTIPNSDIDQDSPVTQPLMTALRDNPTAITEGASGAPKIVNAAVTDGTLGAEKFQTGTTERDWVLARTAGAAAQSIGSYCLGERQTTSSVTNPITQGSTYSASSVNHLTSGTWRAMGAGDSQGSFFDGSFTQYLYIQVFLRIS